MQGLYDLGAIHAIGVSMAKFACRSESWRKTSIGR